METTAYRPSKESRALDSDRSASHSSTADYIRARARRADLPQDDPIPLFLSDPLGAPDPLEFAPLALRSRTRLAYRLAAAGLAISATAIAAVLFQSDLRGLVASIGGNPADAASVQAAAVVNAPAARQTPLKDPARVTNTTLASADKQELPTPSTPSREAIATAYQTALQAQSPVQVQVQAPAPAPVAAQPAPSEPARTLDADTLAGLMTRARSLISVGDIAAARLLLERAANAKDATAALLLAQTYDPAVLGTSDARSVTADAAAARDWYQRAATLGSAEARQRLARLSN
jgi:TPR repeat protein